MSPLTEPTKLTLAKSFTWNESVWNPSMIQTALWLDAADASTLFTTDSGSTLATNNSDVGRWADKSGNGRNFAQSSSGLRPIYNSSNRSIVFSSDLLRASSFSSTIGSDVTLFFIVSPSSGPVGLFDSAPSGANTIRNFASGKWEWWSDSPTFDLGVSSGQVSLLAFQHSLSGTTRTVAYRRNGSAVSTNTATNSNSVNWTLPAIGAINISSNYYAGSVSEVIIATNSALTISGVEKVEGYLAWKWGLTANLPAGHPYKTAGPTP